MVNIVIAEEVPSANKGEAAIIYGMDESFKKIDGIKLSCISRYERDQIYSHMASVHNVEFLARSQSPPALFFQAFGLVLVGIFERLFGRGVMCRFVKRAPFSVLMESDVIFIGHDNVFAKDINLRTVPIVLYAKLTQKPLISYGASIGPFKNVKRLKVRILKKAVLSKIDLFTLRDRPSLDYAKKIGIYRHNMRLTTDVAFLMKPASRQRVQEIMERLGVSHFFEEPCIGFTPTRLLLEHVKRVDGREVPNGDIEVTIKTIAHVIGELIAQLEVSIVLIAHAIGPQTRHDDRVIINEIYKHLENKGGVGLITDDLDAPELKGILGRLSLLVGMRTHSMIGALGMGVPCVALTSEDRFKTNGIIGEQFGLADYLIDIGDLSTKFLLTQIRKAWLDREELASRVRERLPYVSKKAWENGEILQEFLEKRKVLRD